MQVSCIDEARMLGGNYFRGRQDSESSGSPRHFAGTARDIEVLLETTVIDTPEPNVLTVQSERDGVRSLEYNALVIATGAYDRTVAVPGWTLPGVLTAGGASTLIKAYGVSPGKRMLVAGSGPFLLSVADDLAGHGCEVIVAEATPLTTSMGGLPRMAADWGMARQTAGYLWRLTRRGVRRYYGRLVTKIHGSERVTAVTLQRVDRDWRPIAGSDQTIPVDGVCLGFGFVPQLELALSLGCETVYDATVSEFAVKTDNGLRTTKPNIYAAGEVTGIAGVRVALLEGKLAAKSAALDAGILSARAYANEVESLRKPLERASRFARWIRNAYRPRAGLWSLAQPDTVVCRCEDVRLRDATAALQTNPPTPYAVKTATRAGMGLCQGRICAPFWIEWLRTQHGYAMPETTLPWRIRPPLKPVGMAEWLGCDS
jgi:thioredoxin reductase